MKPTLSRLELLRGRLSPETDPLRPPYALGETDFAQTCDGTGACVAACPEKIIVRGGGGLPEIRFANGPCTFCNDCVTACKSGALHMANGTGAPWAATAKISNICLSINGTTCRICEEICDERAIGFRLAVGGAATPQIDRSACSGCGACVAPCPVKAVCIQIPPQTAHMGPISGAHRDTQAAKNP